MIKTKRWVGGADEEYETQHVGFGSQRFKIAVRQMVEQKISTCVKDMQNYLQEALELNDTDRTTLAQSCNKLIGLYCERAGPSLEAIDDEIERVLRIPPNVLLPEDEVQVEQLTDEDYAKLKEEVSSLRKRVERAAIMEGLLTAEAEEVMCIEKACEVAKKDMEVLELFYKNCEKDGSDKTIQSTLQLCENIPFLKESAEKQLFDE